MILYVEEKKFHSVLKENNSLTDTGGIFPHFSAHDTHLTKLCQALFARKGVFFHLFNNKIAANTSVGRGKKSFFSKKENTPLKSNQSFIFV